MDDEAGALVREVNHLVEVAQLGRAREVRQTVERRLVELGRGSAKAAPAAMHFALVVTLMYDDDAAALEAVNDMLEAAERDNALGWRACALAMRGHQKLALGEHDPALYDIDGVLADLADAEAALHLSSDDGYIASCAHVAISNGYVPLRLYELAVPHQEAAYRISVATADPDDAAPSMWLLNLATLHLQWTLELYRVGLDEEAEQHSNTAYDQATAALERLSGDAVDVWRDPCLLVQAVARVDRPDPAGVVDDIQRLLPVIRELGDAHDHALAVPFLAVALLREGRRDESLAVIQQSLSEVRVNDRESPTYLSLAHTYARILATEGSDAAKAALEYGDALAAASWRQRQRTLDAVETSRAYAKLRAEHEQVTRIAETDSLTGVANRRAFDRHLEAVATTEDPGRPVGVLFIDMDDFKQVNDTLGHAVGDTMLQEVAGAISANARDHDMVARVGGDEFAVLLPGAGTDDTEQAARRIIAAVRETPHRLTTVSIGGASGRADDVRATVIRADGAMYVAKRSGRDQHHVVAPLGSAAT